MHSPADTESGNNVGGDEIHLKTKNLRSYTSDMRLNR